MSLLKTQDLNVFYGDLQSLTGVGIDVEKGELTTIVGANASGKSTLINTISGILRQRTGTITFEDRSIEHLPAHQRVAIGIIQIPEGRLLFPDMSVVENLELGAFTPRARRHEEAEHGESLHHPAPPPGKAKSEGRLPERRRAADVRHWTGSHGHAHSPDPG